MSTVLTNGIIIPDNGNRNWGGDLANNWNIIDVNVGYMTDVKNRITTLENSVAENSSNIEINTSNISALQTSKQDTIEDLETIRSGATAGATAVQPSARNNYVDLSSEQTISGAKTFTSQIVGSIDKAEKDLDGNIITSTYATKSELANKLKTLNRINQRALSLPDPSPAVFISKSLPASGGTITADVDSWFEIRTKATSPNALIQLFVAGGNATYAKNTGDALIISVPLRAGVSVTIFYRDIETPTVCRLVPCTGNI